MVSCLFDFSVWESTNLVRDHDCLDATTTAHENVDVLAIRADSRRIGRGGGCGGCGGERGDGRKFGREVDAANSDGGRGGGDGGGKPDARLDLVVQCEIECKKPHSWYVLYWKGGFLWWISGCIAHRKLRMSYMRIHRFG